MRNEDNAGGDSNFDSALLGFISVLGELSGQPDSSHLKEAADYFSELKARFRMGDEHERVVVLNEISGTGKICDGLALEGVAAYKKMYAAMESEIAKRRM